MAIQLSDAEKSLLETWRERARASQHSHHDAGKLCRIAGYTLRVPAIALPVIIGAIALAYVNTTLPNPFQILISALGIASATCSVLDVIFRFSDNSMVHARLGAEYGILRREIERILSLGLKEGESVYAEVERLEARFDQLAGQGPVVSTAIFNQTKKRIGMTK